MTRAVLELRINDRDLALWLGCIPAETIEHHVDADVLAKGIDGFPQVGR
jgi:hypothetical protein